MGLVRARCGEINFEGNQIREWPAHRVAQSGMGLVPEGRQIFPNLNVIENLVATSANRFKNKNPWTLDRVFNLFPSLLERAKNMGNQLSGGEQQMLAIGRGLMSKPKLLMLDEPSLGLAPKLVDEVLDTVSMLKAKGITILLVEQNVQESLDLADRGYLLQTGRIVAEGTGTELRQSDLFRSAFLGI